MWAFTKALLSSPAASYVAGVSPLSPVVKSLVADNEPAAVGLRGRVALMHRLEARFRFLAVSATDFAPARLCTATPRVPAATADSGHSLSSLCAADAGLDRACLLNALSVLSK